MGVSFITYIRNPEMDTNKETISRLKVRHYAMERDILDISVKDKKGNDWTRGKSKVNNIIQTVTKLKRGMQVI